jgi:hypothetical protein
MPTNVLDAVYIQFPPCLKGLIAMLVVLTSKEFKSSDVENNCSTMVRTLREDKCSGTPTCSGVISSHCIIELEAGTATGMAYNAVFIL